MHDQALMRDVLAQVEAVARAEGAARVTGVHVRLGALSHFTPEHFREHFEQAAQGTVADGAAVVAALEGDIDHPHAAGVVLESVEVER
jgi:hydrogenase nickel incorporation protein HypA/HybF